ncbi:MAG: branched-chain amino acid ABC transporter ATP-binding protein/permease [Candidatus Eremiobacteraeota bacterium]|nr:branched-chain amino acid ABC transporter ATP-binding protein/permease [Candidatus Eremiobacteraeota bacterium]
MSERMTTDARLLPIFAAIVIAFGFIAHGNANLVQAATFAAIDAVAAIGLSILLGNVASISIGQAGFFGIGAYAFAYLETAVTWPAVLPLWATFVIATVAGTALATAFGLVLGLIALRFRGHYLAMATLAFGLVVVGVVRITPALGGASGISNIAFAQFGSLSISGVAAYWYAWAMVALVASLTYNLLRGRTGRAFEAVRNDELAAEAVGVPTRRVKIAAFAYAGALAGFAGTFYAAFLGLIEPNAVGVDFSIDLLLMVVVGGAGGVSGAILGAVIIGITNVYGHDLENWRPIIYGAAVVVIAIRFPRGLVGTFARSRRRATPVVEAVPEVDVRDASPVAPPATPSPRERVAWLSVESLAKRFGGIVAVNDVSFALESGTLTSLIGPNGAGKTTLFNTICGVTRPSAGRVTIAGRDVTGWQAHRIAALGVGRSFQNARLFADMTVLENVLAGAYLRETATFASDLLALPLSRRSGRIAADRARSVLSSLDLERIANVRARDLAFGDRRRVELARSVAAEPGLLLLDEPAAGLNASERARLRDDLLRLRSDGLTLLLVEHDMRLVMAISDRVMVLEFGAMIADGRPAAVRDDPRVVAAYLGTG